VATGICASDLKYLRWGSTQIAGHEFAGVLDDGTAVAVEGFFGCEQCEQCEQGTYNMCAKPTCARNPHHARDIPSPGQLAPRDRTLQNLGCLDTTRVSPDTAPSLPPAPTTNTTSGPTATHAASTGNTRQHQCDSVAARGRCRDGERFCCGGYDR
jgi:threonine dehydrogenase-like Zn-dependent dehydrogenase